MAKFTWQDGTLVSKAKVEVGGTIYEVDPEEYSGATPLSASNLNAMQDGIYEDIGDKSQLKTDNKASLVNAINNIIDTEIYSTSEIKTNKIWIDGKPIYRIVCVINSPVIGNTNYPHYISDFGTLISATANGIQANGNQQYFPRAVPGDSNWSLNIGDINNTTFSLQIAINNTGNYVFTKVNVILEYTKTTD